jgi:hypothetical protein
VLAPIGVRGEGSEPGGSLSLAGLRPWMQHVPGIATAEADADADAGRPLAPATAALSLALLGRRPGVCESAVERERVRVLSRQVYGQALRALARALAESECRREDRTLAACMILAIYEVYECPAGSRDAYASHVDGCARLVEMRGPEAHRTLWAHSLFTAFRTMGVCCISITALGPVHGVRC